MREDRQLQRALELIKSYDGSLPLSIFLKQFFRSHKEMGSHDRRYASDLVFSWFRIGRSLAVLNEEERLACACFLVMNKSNPVVHYIIDKHTSISITDINLTLGEKINILKLKYDFNIDLSPFELRLSDELNRNEYASSMLIQPLFWLRTRMEFSDRTEKILSEKGIAYQRENKCFGLEPGINLADAGVKDGWYEVQDKSSQATASFFQPKAGESWYDCCAASGGKSLLLLSLQPDIKLTVSDNRDSILLNLKERFLKNGVKKFNAITADLTIGVPDDLMTASFDGIIADVPCSGSGTWSRTPERLTYFNEQSLVNYSRLQEGVIRNVVPLLKKDKPLIYITCSVFKEENEDRVYWICKEFGFEIEEMKLLAGYLNRADTLFAARLIKK